MKNETGKRRISSLLNNSLVYSSLDRLAALIYRKLGSGFFAGMMTAYGDEDRTMRSGFFASIADRLQFGRKLKVPFAKGCERSTLLGAVCKLTDILVRCRLRCYGAFMLAFGLIYSLSTLYGAWKYDFLQIDTVACVVCATLLLCGFLLLFSGETLARGIYKTRLLHYVTFDVLGVRHGAILPDCAPCGKITAAFGIGCVFGVISHFIPALWLIAACIGVLALYTVLIIPESGVVVTLFTLPFLPTMLLVAMVLYTFLCYLLKLCRGKRTFRMSILDASVAAFFIFMAAGGISSAGGTGSIKPTLVYLCFMLSYYLFVNLIRSEAWIRRCITATCVSGTLVALYGVYQNFFVPADTTWQDTDMFSNITGRVVSTFENPNVLGEYLIMIIPLMLSLTIISGRASGKFGYFMLMCSCGACLVFTWSRGAWLGIIFAMLIFFMVYTRKTLIICLCGLFALPFAPFVLPDNIVGRIMSIGNLADTSTSYRVSIWEAAVKILRDNALTGIGVGNAAFSKVYPKYSLAGIEAAPHAHNLFLQTGIELGIPGLIVLVAIFFILTQSCMSFIKHSSDNDRVRGKLVVTALFAGIAAVLLQGMTDYIWYNYRAYLMFWCMIGLCAAVQRVATDKESGDILSPTKQNEVE